MCYRLLTQKTWQRTSKTSNFILYFGYMLRPQWDHHQAFHFNRFIKTLRTLSFSLPHRNRVRISLLSRVPHAPILLRHKIWWGYRITKFLIVELSPAYWVRETEVTVRFGGVRGLTRKSISACSTPLIRRRAHATKNDRSNKYRQKLQK